MHILKLIVVKFNLKKRSDDFKSSINNAFFNSIETILYPLLWVIVTPIFVSKLGAEQYGIWMLVNGFMGFGGGVLGLGLADATIKFVSKYNANDDKENVANVIRTTMTIYCCLGLIVGIIVLWFAPFIVKNIFQVNVDNYDLAIVALQIAGIGIIFRFINDVFRSVIYAFERHDLNAKITMCVDVVTMIFNVTLVFIGFDLFAVLITTVTTLGIGAIIKAYYSKIYFVQSLSYKPLISKHLLNEVFSYSFFTWLQSILRFIQSNLDRFIIAGMVSVSALTYYVIALKIAQILHNILAKATSFIFPMVAKLLEEENIERLKLIYHKSTIATIILTASLIFPTYLFSYNILELWMGIEFADQAIIILYIFLIKYMFHPIGIVSHHFLLGTGLVKLNVKVLAITAPIIIITMLILIPEYGLTGAALAHLISIPSVLILRIISEKIIFNEYNLMINLLYIAPQAVLCLLTSYIVINYKFEFVNYYNIIPLYLITACILFIMSYVLFSTMYGAKLIKYKLN